MASKLTIEEIRNKVREYCPLDHNGKGDWEKCFEYLLMGVKLNDEVCLTNAAFFYENGYGCEVDAKKAVQLSRKAAKLGGAVAMCHLGRYYEDGFGVEEDHKKAFKYFQMSAQKGYSQAIGTLGDYYMRGDGVKQDSQKAVECWQKAVELGENYYALFLAACYLRGEGAKKDLVMFKKYLGIAKKVKDADEEFFERIKELEEEQKHESSAKKEKTAKSRSKGKKAQKEIGEFHLPGREGLTKYFNEEILDYFRNEKAYEEMGIHSVPATLLYGPPGCGKTYAVQQVAKCLNMPVYEINSATVGDSYIHGTAMKIARIFQKAKETAPCVLIIDEMETYLGSRGSGDWKARMEETDEFLRHIPDAIEKKVIIFGMTNKKELLDDAALRTGRFDKQIEVGPASKEEIAQVLVSELAKTKAQKDIETESMAKEMLGRPLSDVTYVVRQAIRRAVRGGRREVTKQDLEQEVAELIKTRPVKKNHEIGFKVQ